MRRSRPTQAESSVPRSPEPAPGTVPRAGSTHQLAAMRSSHSRIRARSPMVRTGDVAQRRLEGDRGPDRSRRRYGRRVGGDRRERRLAGERGQCRVALLLGDGKQREHRPGGRRVEQVDGQLLTYAQPARLRHPPDVGTQHLPRLHGCRTGGAGSRVAVHERIEPRVGQPETDVQVPAGAQVVDRVAAGRAEGLLREIGVEAVLGDGVEQAGLSTMRRASPRRSRMPSRSCSSPRPARARPRSGNTARRSTRPARPTWAKSSTPATWARTGRRRSRPCRTTPPRKRC